MVKTQALGAALVAAIVLGPAVARAEGMHGKGAQAFQQADKDHDGTLDREEAKAMPRVEKNFDAIDKDKDGTVSLAEIHAFMKVEKQAMHDKAAAAFKSADKDHDGTLDKEEAKAMPRVAKNFDKIDANKDGKVTLDEIHSFMKVEQKAMHEKGSAKFQAADKDGDGSLDKEEAKAMPRVAENFDAIDADKDGKVTVQELHAFMKAQKAQKAAK